MISYVFGYQNAGIHLFSYAINFATLDVKLCTRSERIDRSTISFEDASR